MSPHNTILLSNKSVCRFYHPFILHPTMRAKYPTNKLLRAVFEKKEVENETGFLFVISRCQNLKFGDFRSLLCRVPQKYVLKCVPHVQHKDFSSFKQ